MTGMSMMEQLWQGTGQALHGTSIALKEWSQIGSKAIDTFGKIKNSPPAFSKALSITRHTIILLGGAAGHPLAWACGCAETLIDLSQTFGSFRFFGEEGLSRLEHFSWGVANLANAAKWLSDNKILFVGRFAKAAGWITAGTLGGFTVLGISTAIAISDGFPRSTRLAWCVAEVALIVFPMVMTISTPVLTGGIIVVKSLGLVSFIYEQKV